MIKKSANTLLHLKGRFENKARLKTGFGGIVLKDAVSSEHLRNLAEQLQVLKREWTAGNYLISGALVSVFYVRVIPKSLRIGASFGNPADCVVGARFTEDLSKHIITHHVSLDVLEETSKSYSIVASIVEQFYHGVFSNVDLKDNKQIDYKLFGLSKTKFQKFVFDASVVESFGNYRDESKSIAESIVSVFKTEETSTITKTIELMKKMGIELYRGKFIDSTTMLLSKDELELLVLNNPYLISMSVQNLSDFEFDDAILDCFPTVKIDKPTNEPVIGVIDTLFDENVYFSEWVDYRCMVSPDIPCTSKDALHGTAVSSIIVDGCNFNPEWDDGCGRFRVRHFGVATASHFSSFTILQKIREIVLTNRDIKVWNLCLGSPFPVSKHYISPEGALLDELQSEFDIIFIVAGTNKGSNKEDRLIGAPADSLNSIVVNSVSREGLPASYSRSGPALSFFVKPDVCCFGGEYNDCLTVCTAQGEQFKYGTSFSAPWVARKMSYMIDKLGMDRNVAKALLIHAANPWVEENRDRNFYGHGIVPTHIRDIIESPSDEIRFVVSDVSKAYSTYNYELPVPLDKGKHPYVVKATMCYFPVCSRNQGVDYTNTEFEFAFSRLNKDGKLMPRSNKIIKEDGLRSAFRKWDNVKIIKDEIKKKNGPRKCHDEQGRWGIQITTLERLTQKYGENMRFGIVISLKATDKKNRRDDFIRQCRWKGWIVNEIEIEQQLEIHQMAEQEIVFE